MAQLTIIVRQYSCSALVRASVDHCQHGLVRALDRRCKLRYIGAPTEDPRGYFPSKDSYIIPLGCTCLFQPRFPYGTAIQTHVSGHTTTDEIRQRSKFQEGNTAEPH